MIEAKQSSHRSKGLLAWLIVSQLLVAVSLYFWYILLGFSVMAFDGGETPEAWRFVHTVWAYPIFPLVTVIGTWAAYARRKNKLAAILAGISFAPPILLFFYVVIINIVG